MAMAAGMATCISCAWRHGSMAWLAVWLTTIAAMTYDGWHQRRKHQCISLSQNGGARSEIIMALQWHVAWRKAWRSSMAWRSATASRRSGIKQQKKNQRRRQNRAGTAYRSIAAAATWRGLYGGMRQCHLKQRRSMGISIENIAA